VELGKVLSIGEDVLDNVIQKAINILLMQKAINILVVLIASLISIKIINFVFKKCAKKANKENDIHFRFINKLINGLVWFTCLIMILRNFEVLEKYFVSILASSSVLAVIIGFAAQQSLGNVIAGMFISLFKTFQIGDRIKLVNSGITGIVEDITLRHTTIRNFENSLIVVPNGTINNEIIENINGYVCNFLDFTVEYNSDLTKIHNIVTKLVQSNINYHTPDNSKEVTISCRDINLYGVQIRVSIWTDNIGASFKTVSQIREQLIQEFNSNNIKLIYLNKAI
jgi:small-conductance mechanosensitive channel